MADKTIRYNIDDKGVAASNDRIRRSFEETQRKALDAANANKKLTKEEIADLERRIKLQRELNKEQEASLRKEIERRKIGYDAASESLRQWERNRKAISDSLTGAEKERFDQQTGVRRGIREEGVSRMRQDVLDRKTQLLDTRDSNQKQIRELQTITETIKGESGKDRRTAESVIRQASVAGGTVARGDMAGMLRLLGGLGFAGAIVGGIGALGVSAIASSEAGAKDYGRVTGTSIEYSLQQQKELYRYVSGKSGTTTRAMSKFAAQLLPSFGGELGAGDLTQLYGISASRGISSQQLAQLLMLQRYSGRGGVETTASFEQYLKSTGQSLVRLPEILGSYLGTANNILNRTGRVDAIGLQQSMTSIAKSYGVSGLGLDRMTSGIESGTMMSSNPMLKTIQFQTLRSLYPDKSPWELMKIFADPLAHPEYQQAYIERLKKMGGPSAAPFALQSAFGNLSPMEIDKIIGGEYRVASKGELRPAKVDYTKEAEQMTGTFEALGKQIANGLQGLGNWITLGTTQNEELLKKMDEFDFDKLMKGIGKEIKSAVSNSIVENKHLLDSRK